MKIRARGGARALKTQPLYQVMRLRQLIEESRERQSEVEEERGAHSQALLESEAAKSRLEKELRVQKDHTFSTPSASNALIWD